MALSYDEAVKNLTAPGAPFELVTETVRGLPMRIFKNREKSMREKVANAGLRGDTEFLVQGEPAHLVRRVRAPGLGDGRRAARRSRSAPRRSPRDPLLQLARLADRALRGHLGGRDRASGSTAGGATEEIEYGLRDSGSRFLVVDERLFPRVAPLLGQLPGLERVFYIGEPAAARA